LSSTTPKQYPCCRAASMIIGAASVDAWPAGVSIGPSWSRTIASGRSWATIAFVVCDAVFVGS
jgi:hypothetical protein